MLLELRKFFWPKILVVIALKTEYSPIRLIFSIPSRPHRMLSAKEDIYPQTDFCGEALKLGQVLNLG